MRRRPYALVSKLNNSGQSLLEVVVLIGLALVIVTGLTVVTVNGLKNSQFSQNQAQATRLAKDGIDRIRSMREQNCPVNIGTPSAVPYYWYDNSNLIWSQTLSSGSASFRFVPANCSSVQPNGTGLQSQAANTADSSISTSLQTTFRRIITLENFSPTQKKVNVQVQWSDLSGTHQSNLTTIIGQNQ